MTKFFVSCGELNLIYLKTKHDENFLEVFERFLEKTVRKFIRSKVEYYWLLLRNPCRIFQLLRKIILEGNFMWAFKISNK